MTDLKRLVEQSYSTLVPAKPGKPGKSVIFKTIYFYLKQRISFFYKVLEIAGFPGFYIHKIHDKYLYHNKKQQVPASILLALLLAFCWLCCHASLYIIQDYFKNINLIVMHIAINPVKTPVFVVIHDLAVSQGLATQNRTAEHRPANRRVFVIESPSPRL